MTNPRIPNKQHNWNADWYNVLVPIARNVIKRSWGHDLQIDELINEAWINSLRRLHPDTDIKIVTSCAKMSMRQYVVGSPAYRNKIKFNQSIQSLYDDEGELIIRHMADKRHVVSYDDVDDLEICLQRYSFLIRSVLLAKLQGQTQKEIAKQQGVSEAAISLRLRSVGLCHVIK
ncbi:MAG: sigma-70 family RNA polymerase sigma factor [Planctomycetes bacterium]|nr:sigma-70 family RNA polymerase sigma factor [Planctomycetota bacterium]